MKKCAGTFILMFAMVVIIFQVRTKVIATHALCSFANFGSVGIQLGAISYIAPERREDIIKTVWFAFIIGSLCGILNACIAGVLITA